MARLGKAKLVAAVMKGIHDGGWSTKLTSPADAHPARIAIQKDGQTKSLLVYIWNLTHGGGAARPEHEYRIQITSGIRAFKLEPDNSTLILGWDEKFGVFAAFDASRRTGPLGSSPSIQISAATLNAARLNGAAVQNKGNGEFAIAVRPDRLPAYVQFQASAHAGEIGGILAENDGADLDEKILDKAIEGLRDFKVGTEKELRQRRTIFERLEALEREMALLKPVMEARGHNRPPELPVSEDDQLLRSMADARSSIRDELSKPDPDTKKVATGAKFFSWLGTCFKSAKAELKKLGKKIKEKARDKAAELVIATLVGGAALWNNISYLVELLVSEITKWFHLL